MYEANIRNLMTALNNAKLDTQEAIDIVGRGQSEFGLIDPRSRLLTAEGMIYSAQQNLEYAKRFIDGLKGGR